MFASVVRCRCRVSHIANARVHAACLFRCRPPVYLGALVVGGWDNNRRRFGQAVSAFCLHANCVDKNSSHKCLMGSTIDSAREESCKCECLFVRAITHAANFQFSPDGRKLGWTERSRNPCMPCNAISVRARVFDAGAADADCAKRAMFRRPPRSWKRLLCAVSDSRRPSGRPCALQHDTRHARYLRIVGASFVEARQASLFHLARIY